MISYEAAPGAKVFIKGSEVLKDGWVQAAHSGRRSRRRRPGRGDAVADHRMAPRIHRRDVSRCLPAVCPAQHHGQLVVARSAGGRHGPVSSPAWTGVRRRQAAGARGTTARTGGAAVCSRSPTSRFPPSRKTACRRVAGADRSCRRSAARPMRASGWSRRDRRFRSVWLRERRRTTRSK